MATAAASAAKLKIKELHFLWEGKDRNGKAVKGEMRAAGDHVVNATLRRQGIIVTKIKRRRAGTGGSVKEKDITLFTRQLATMMKAGVPLLQSFDIVGKGIASTGALEQAILLCARLAAGRRAASRVSDNTRTPSPVDLESARHAG